MALLGAAFVAIWHGIQTGVEADYIDWHTREHMPERMTIPGFLRGRRYVDWSLQPHSIFTMYEGASTETFRSPDYLARLDDPTPRSKGVQPQMTNFLRGVCETMLSLGEGVGGAITSVRLAAGKPGTEFDRCLTSLALELSDRAGVTSVHVARHDPPLASDQKTAEARMRPSVHVEPFSHVVLIEGTSNLFLARDHGRAERSILEAGVVRIAVATYPMSFSLLVPG